MKVNGISYRAVWMKDSELFMINQLKLPFHFEIISTQTYSESCIKIKDMTVRGAGTIGATAGFAMAQAFLSLVNSQNHDYQYFLRYLNKAKEEIEATRPTANDLFYAVNRVYQAGIEALNDIDISKAAQLAYSESQTIADTYAESSRTIGENGLPLIKDKYNILTHCNAGWLALVDYGSALSPLFLAHEKGLNIHVWVDETRPRSQGAKLTAWELKQAGIPHTIVADNAAALLMMQGKVDIVITGADRIAANGDTANKLGTLEKAILAKEFNVPFYIAAPFSTFDKNCATGNDIIIEKRDEKEVLFMQGADNEGYMRNINICNPGSAAYNPAFDVTPAKYIKGYITEKGILASAKDFS